MTPLTSTDRFTGSPMAGVVEPGVDGSGNVGATSDVGGTAVGAGLGVSSTQAASPMAAKLEAIKNFSFINKG